MLLLQILNVADLSDAGGSVENKTTHITTTKGYAVIEVRTKSKLLPIQKAINELKSLQAEDVDAANVHVSGEMIIY